MEAGQLMYFDFTVTDENDIVYAWYYLHAIAESVKIKTLMPGEQLTSTYQWFTEGIGIRAIPKGNYFVKACSRPFRLATGDNANFTNIALETPTISITIR